MDAQIGREADPRESARFRGVSVSFVGRGGRDRVLSAAAASPSPVIGVTSAVHPRGRGACRLLINYLPGGRGDFRRCPILRHGHENCNL